MSPAMLMLSTTALRPGTARWVVVVIHRTHARTHASTCGGARACVWVCVFVCVCVLPCLCLSVCLSVKADTYQ